MSSTEVSPSTLTRREALTLGAKLGVVAGIVALTGSAEPQPESLYQPEVDEMMAAAKPYIANEQVPRAMPTHEQVAVADNPRLAQRARSKDTHAVVVVHPGYFTQSVTDAHARAASIRSKDQLTPSEYSTKDEIMGYDREDIGLITSLAKGKEGNYGAYRTRLEQVMARASRDPQTPLVVYNEGRRLYSGEQRRGLETPRHALHIATIDNDPTPTKDVRYQGPDGVEAAAQHEELMYEWLERHGVDTVHLAGEYGLLPGGGLDAACLGTVALNFIDRGFNVHGIEGAIFPSNPAGWSPSLQPNESPHQYSSERIAGANAMYRDTVPIQ